MSHRPTNEPCSAPADPLAALDEEIDRLAARCQRLAAWLELRLARGLCREADALRCLTALSQITGRLAAVLARRAAAGQPDEIERFLADVSRRAFELAASDANSQPATDTSPPATAN